MSMLANLGIQERNPVKTTIGNKMGATSTGVLTRGKPKFCPLKEMTASEEPGMLCKCEIVTA